MSFFPYILHQFYMDFVFLLHNIVRIIFRGLENIYKIRKTVIIVAVSSAAG